MKALVTGSQGFIGRHLVSTLLDRDHRVWGLDALTYAGDEQANYARPGFDLIRSNACELATLSGAIRPDVIFHLAAESHVDRSIEGAAHDFVSTNVLGTLAALHLARREKARFVHVSTDEVTGDRWKRSDADEDTPIETSSPYSASKAAAELLVRAYVRTYALNAVIVRPCNVYGPYQHPEKLIPRACTYALAGRSIPIYGDGQQERQWLHVEDCVRGIIAALSGKTGECYCLTTHGTRTNREVVDRIAYQLKADVERVQDRPGHDRRYAQNGSKARRQLDWIPQVQFDAGLRATIEWYACAEGRAWAQKMIARGGRW